MVILFQYDVNTNSLESGEMENDDRFILDEWRKNMQNHLHNIKNKEE
jgi:hypothetical protein